MAHADRRSGRLRGEGPGDLHADRGFRARVSRIRRKTATQVRRQLSNDPLAHLAWPFFDDVHRKMAGDLATWAPTALAPHADVDSNVDAACRSIVRQLGEHDWLRYCIPSSHGGAFAKLDVRALCLVREALGQ